MNQSRPALKVGIFVLVALVVLGALIATFTKSGGWFSPTYDLRGRASSVSGLKQGSVILMSGVPVGTVKGAELAADGKGVFIRMQLQSRFKIHSDARFMISQIGFLGDQFVAIVPRENQGPLLQGGQEVVIEEPLNVQESVRTATDLLQEASKTVKTVNEMVVRLDRIVLSEGNLTNVNVALRNVRLASERVLNMVDGVNRLVDTNSRPIFISVSNMVRFSEELTVLAQELGQTVETNRMELTKAIKSLETAAGAIQRVSSSVEKGEGLAGALIKDPALKTQFEHIAQNLETVSSNISRHGLLYKPKQPKPDGDARPFRGKPPF